MSPKSALLFKVLLNRFHHGAGETALKNIPKEEINEVLAHKIDSDDASAALHWTKDLIGRVHYSWLAPAVLQMPPSIQKSVAASFSERQSKGLQKVLKFDALPASVAPSVKRFLLDRFFHHWNLEGVLPLSFLPPSPLKPLLDMNKDELVLLIDYLSLYDVAEAVRHIVDKNRLKAIYRALTPDEQAYLRVCIHKKERIASPKLNMEKWDGDPEKLRIILHRRGMFRLSKAISGQSKEFLWHLVHILDTGRGKTVEEEYEEKEVPGITPFLIQQLKGVLDYLKNKSST